MTSSKEDFLRDHFKRQQEIGRKSLEAIASMAQANAELIAAAGQHEITKKQIPFPKESGNA